VLVEGVPFARDGARSWPRPLFERVVDEERLQLLQRDLRSASLSEASLVALKAHAPANIARRLSCLSSFYGSFQTSTARAWAPTRWLRRQSAQEGHTVDEDHLAKRLKDIGLLLEINAQTAERLADLVGRAPRDVRAALSPLIHAGPDRPRP
jgi:hypothetical protein